MRHLRRVSSFSNFLLFPIFCWACTTTSPAGPSSPSAEESSASGAPETSAVRASNRSGNDERRPHPLVDERQPTPEASLPRLSYKHLGMHIGGESNSEESKRPWLSDIERHEDALLSCYRMVDEPRKGGSYGVDLYVGKRGGKPEVRGSRQKLGGEDFDGCMREAFGKIEFHEPARPTVFSYSIFFRLEE